MALQRQAARRQVEKLGIWLPLGGDPKPPEETADAPCEPMSELAIAPVVDRVSRDQEIEPRLLRAVIQQESGFRPCAVSAHGAQGLMQIMPATAGELGLDDPFDPPANVEAGAKYLRQLLDRYNGDLFRALGAYNAGPTAVDEADGVPAIPETLDYVNAIVRKLSRK